MEIVGGNISLLEKKLARRVAEGCCQPQAPSESCVRVSPHTAQAFEKVSLVGIAANPKASFTVLPDRQNSHWHTERTIRRCLLLSLLSSDSTRFHVTRDPLNVCLLTESCTWQDIPAITAKPSLLSASLSRPPSACLAVRLPRGRRNWVSTACPERDSGFRTVDPLDEVGVPSTPVARSRFIGMVYGSVSRRWRD
jgi:hypothetical protein